MILKSLDFLSTVFFVIVYKYYDLYVATSVLMIMMTLGIGLHVILKEPIKKLQFWSWVVVMVFGFATVLLRDPVYITWKPTLINGSFSLLLFGSLFKERCLLEQMLSSIMIGVPKKRWLIWNTVSGFYFLSLAIVNRLVVIYGTEEQWVNFKVFGIACLNFVYFFISLLFFRSWLSLK